MGSLRGRTGVTVLCGGERGSGTEGCVFAGACVICEGCEYSGTVGYVIREVVIRPLRISFIERQG